jgi:hypothetical protein
VLNDAWELVALHSRAAEPGRDEQTGRRRRRQVTTDDTPELAAHLGGEQGHPHLGDRRRLRAPGGRPPGADAAALIDELLRTGGNR